MSQFQVQTENRYMIKAQLLQNVNLCFRVQSSNNRQLEYFFQENFTYQNIPNQIKIFIENLQELYTYLHSDPQSILAFQQSGQQGTLRIKVIVGKKQKTYQLKLKKKQQIKKQLPKVQFLSIKKIQDENQSNPHQELENELAVLDMQIEQYTNTINVLEESSKIKDKQLELAKKQNQRLKLKIKTLQLSIKSESQSIQKQPLQQSSVIVAYQKTRGIYQQHLDQDSSKLRRLFLKSQKMNDESIKQMMVFSWTDIQILSLGDNLISDQGLKALFNNKQWPLLQKIYLQNNHLKQINYFHQLPALERLTINDNILEKSSAVYFSKCCFTSLKHLQISFKKGINTECWNLLLKQNFEMFPALARLNYQQKEDVSETVKKDILKKCNQQNILLNHEEQDGLGNLGQLIALIQLKNLLEQQ